MIGRVLSGRYEIIERVGGGGMAFVYRARDVLLNRTVAIKVLSPHYTSDEDFVRKFRREAQAAASLSNPNIVGIFDVGQDGDIYYIVMEFIEGRTLKQVITENGPLPVGTALQIGKQIAEALRSAHKHGVIHRDIKPHNIMITGDGHVKVTDFGIARATTSSTLTNSGAMIGSVHYISPEQARGGFTGERSDIYSFGVVLYEMLVGDVPFAGESMFSIALKHLQEPVTPLRQIDAGIPTEVDRIVLKAMAKDQASRYQTADELLQDLNAVLREVGKKENLRDFVANRKERPMQHEESLEKTYVPRRSRDAVAVEAPAKEARQRPWWHYASVAAIILALSGIAFMAWMFWPRPVVEVPDLYGRDLVEAQRILSNLQLSYTVVSQQYSDNEPNTVIDQDPPAGRQVRASREIALTISKGPEYADVPNVIGQTLREAEIQLQNAGFVVGTVNRVFSDQSLDTVLDQNPLGGTQLRRSTPIILTVSDGKAPTPLVMPRLLKLSPDAAHSQLAELGLVLGTEDGLGNDVIVIDQTPAPGTEIAQGSAVNLRYGPRVLTVIFEYMVPANSDLPNHQVEIFKEDLNGASRVYSERMQRGEEVRLTITGTGRMKITVKDNGTVTKTQEYPQG